MQKYKSIKNSFQSYIFVILKIKHSDNIIQYFSFSSNTHIIFNIWIRNLLRIARLIHILTSTNTISIIFIILIISFILFLSIKYLNICIFIIFIIFIHISLNILLIILLFFDRGSLLYYWTLWHSLVIWISWYLEYSETWIITWILIKWRKVRYPFTKNFIWINKIICIVFIISSY